jgi:hypothetical protein
MNRLARCLLGIVAVGLQAVPQTAHSAAADETDWSAAHALATAPRCGVDEIVHRIQGQPVARLEAGESIDGESICPAAASDLDPKFGISASPVFYFDISIEHDAAAARAGYPGYVLEGSMHGVGPPGSPGVQCVYVGCTKLQVAAQGVATIGRESCLGPLPGGTSQPAAHAVACPAAVKIGGAFRPFTRARPHGLPGNAEAPACCYTVPAPIPPSL